MTVERQAFTPKVTEISESATAIGPGKTIFLSGQIALSDEGAPVGGDMATQAATVFRRLEAALARAGAALGDVVKLTVFVTDLGDLAEFDRVRSEFFAPELPASTAVEVGGLYGDALVEVEAVAFLGGSR